LLSAFCSNSCWLFVLSSPCELRNLRKKTSSETKLSP
jgi:hypothetical protein